MLTERNDWAMVRRWNLEQIEKWRRELEDLNAGADRANQLRGMIYALQEQMIHVDPPTAPEIKEPNYG